MFNVSLRKQRYSPLKRYVIVLTKLSSSDSTLPKVNVPVKLKEFSEEFSRDVKKKKFEKNFIEKLFINEFQPRVLEYPEVGSLKQVESLKQKSNLAQQLVYNTDDKVKVLCKSDVENSVNFIRSYELTGFTLPRSHKGFGYMNSEYSYMQEILGLDPSLSKSIAENDDFGSYVIDMYGSDTQKGTYLSKLGSGELLASFAHVESEQFAILDPDLINTTAEWSSDKQTYTISGEKKWVCNANHADVFIISANVTMENSNGVKVTKPTLFLIPKDVPGLKIHEPIKTIALKNLNMCNVTLDHVVVPSSSALGDVQKGGDIIRDVLSKGKLNNGAQCLPIMRELVNMTIKHCIHADFFKKSKYERDYFKMKIGEIVSQVYAIESMTYLLLGRLDHFINPDLFLESLIVKIFASENLRSLVQTCTEIIGSDIITSDTNWKQIIKDAQFHAASDITNDHLRLVLGITGVQYALDKRNSKNFINRKIYDAKYVLNKAFLVAEHDSRAFYKEILEGYLHCIMKFEARALEDCVSWLFESTYELIKVHGEEVFKKHWELKMVANIVIHIYALTAILGRASRAYCICVEQFEVDRCISAALMCRYHYHVNKLGRQLKYHLQSPKLDYGGLEEKILQSKNYSQMLSIFNNLKIRN